MLKKIPTDYERNRNLVGCSFNSYAHPLAVLVRLCVLFDQRQKRTKADHRWTSSITRGYMLKRFQVLGGDEPVVEKNLQIAADIRNRMVQVVTTGPTECISHSASDESAASSATALSSLMSFRTILLIDSPSSLEQISESKFDWEVEHRG